MPQSMLNGSKRWPEHARQLSRVYTQLAVGSGADFIFGSEMGGIGQGFSCTDVDIAKIVDVALPFANVVCSGAYTSVYNINDRTANLVEGGMWHVFCRREVEMHWQAHSMT